MFTLQNYKTGRKMSFAELRFFRAKEKIRELQDKLGIKDVLCFREGQRDEKIRECKR